MSSELSKEELLEIIEEYASNAACYEQAGHDETQRLDNEQANLLTQIRETLEALEHSRNEWKARAEKLAILANELLEEFEPNRDFGPGWDEDYINWKSRLSELTK